MPYRDVGDQGSARPGFASCSRRLPGDGLGDPRAGRGMFSSRRKQERGDDGTDNARERNRSSPEHNNEEIVEVTPDDETKAGNPPAGSKDAQQVDPPEADTEADAEADAEALDDFAGHS